MRNLNAALMAMKTQMRQKYDDCIVDAVVRLSKRVQIPADSRAAYEAGLRVGMRKGYESGLEDGYDLCMRQFDAVVTGLDVPPLPTDAGTEVRHFFEEADMEAILEGRDLYSPPVLNLTPGLRRTSRVSTTVAATCEPGR